MRQLLIRGTVRLLEAAQRWDDHRAGRRQLRRMSRIFRRVYEG